MTDIEKLKLARELIGEAAVWCLDGGGVPNDGWAAKAWAMNHESDGVATAHDPAAWAALQLERAFELLGEMQEHLAEAEASPCKTWFKRMFLLDGSHMVLCAGIDDGAVWIPASEVDSARENADPEEFKVLDEVNKPGIPEPWPFVPEMVLIEELGRLRDWKASAMAIEASLNAQGIARVLKLPLGSPIHPQILPAIEALLGRVAELERIRGAIPDNKTHALVLKAARELVHVNDEHDLEGALYFTPVTAKLNRAWFNFAHAVSAIVVASPDTARLLKLWSLVNDQFGWGFTVEWCNTQDVLTIKDRLGNIIARVDGDYQERDECDSEGRAWRAAIDAIPEASS